jgi:Ca2+-binding RTX toxin-like protein
MLLLSFTLGAQYTESTSGHTYSSGNWQALPATPGSIKSSAMAYSPDDNKLVLYGGRSPTGIFINELWVYDLGAGTWTKKTNWNCTPSCPAGRAVHTMVYDDLNNKFVIFGGFLISGHSFETNETWTYDLATNTWKKLDFGSQAVPAVRHWGSLEYNPDDKFIYMFGGHRNAGNCPGDLMYNDVWKLNIAGVAPAWTKLNPTPDAANGLPSPRQSDWIYIPPEKVFYVFGGKQELGPTQGTACSATADGRETFYNDIWKYDPSANQWTRIQSTKTDYTHFPKERRTDIVYDDAQNRILFYSGLRNNDLVFGEDTWLYDFDNDRWSTVQDTDGVVPSVWVNAAAAWDDRNDTMYIFGSDDRSDLPQFWKLKIAKNNISVNCFSKQPTIFGTEGNDAGIFGNDAVNVVYGSLGDDTIRGDLGGDFLCGAKGNDKIFGDDGNDKLWGFDGNDEILGGAGNDDIRGGIGNDKLRGDAGKDKFQCGTGTDSIIDFKPSEGDTKTADCENF